MAHQAQYSSATASNVRQVLQGIVNAPPSSFPKATRGTLVQNILDDVSHCSSSGKKDAPKLVRKDYHLALLAIKTLGRAPEGSQVLATSENLTKLLDIHRALNATDGEAASETLRCIANALLLIEEGRSTWVKVGGAQYCVELLEVTPDPSNLFLLSRILFLTTASEHTIFIPTLFRPTSPQGKRSSSRGSSGSHSSGSKSQSRGHIITTIDSRLDLLLNSILTSAPMSKEAMTDLLKFTFNLLVYWPKITSSEANSASSKGKETTPDTGVMGERWSDRLNAVLPPLLRTFNNLPPTFPSPLAAPLTHTIHSLITVPVKGPLYNVWFPDHPSDSTEDVPGTPSSSGSTTSHDEKDKDKEIKSAFDKAKSILPRLSLSSRPTSPSTSPTHAANTSASGSPTNRASRIFSSPPPPSPPASVSGPPKVLTRALDLLDVTLSHYMPGNVEPDDKTVKQICTNEDINLDDTVSPLVVLLTRLCAASEACRKGVKERLLPVDLDRTSPLEGRPDMLGRCLRLMASVYHQRLKDSIGEYLFTVCDSDATTLCGQIGYGNAAGFLFNRGVLTAPPPKANSPSGSGSDINPITGMVNQERKVDLPEMTEEEKEREAEKLFVLFERLGKAGAIAENPLRAALREGKMEKYKKGDEGSDSD